MRPIAIAYDLAPGHNVSFWVGAREAPPGEWWTMGLIDLDGYRRRVDDSGEARVRLRSIPRDMATLLELARDIELEERIILDRTHYDE